ncbi:MAG: flagellar M-ring protein FliF [bacterium]|nr:flagellar M-ring protein FliF [bacterium]
MPDLLTNIRDAFSRLTRKQKIQIALALVGTLGLVWGVSHNATRIRYETLFARLDADDAAQIVSALKERQVPYELSRGGTAVDVPTDLVDELRIEFAGEGMPRGGGVGFEIFDKPTFGLSDFVQSVNYRRALERELARSIQSLESVQSARVHLALPDDSVFVDEQQTASASVVVRLRGATPLPRNRVNAVALLVASAVEGLDASRVSVIDGHGRMLSNGSGDVGDEGLSGTQLETKTAMERRIESTLVSIVEPVVGAGRVRARATVELETARVERVEETYDPDAAVIRSEQRSKRRNSGSGPGGVPGTTSNLPDAGGARVNAGGGALDESQTVTRNFEINKAVSTIAEPRGTLLRQSVAVVVDHAVAPTDDQDESTEQAPLPRTDEEMQKITALVRAAVGIDEERGDLLIVENVPFDEALIPTIGEEGGNWTGLVLQILRYAALPLSVLLIALLVIRPGIAAFRAMRPEESEGPMTIGQLQAQLGEGSAQLEGQSSLRMKLIEAARSDPEAAALVVKSWVGNRSEQ